MPSRPISLAALGLLAASAVARAQGFDPAWLDRQAEERNAARGQQPRPALEAPQPSTPPQRVHRPSELTVCMSTPPWTPIHGAPDRASPVVGYTTAWVAVTKRTGSGFAEVLLYNGKGRGYVPTAAVTPFRNELKPGGTCAVVLADDGRPLFRQR